MGAVLPRLAALHTACAASWLPAALRVPPVRDASAAYYAIDGLVCQVLLVAPEACHDAIRLVHPLVTGLREIGGV